MLILATYSPHCLQIAYCTLTVQVLVQSPVAYINAPVMLAIPQFASSTLTETLSLLVIATCLATCVYLAVSGYEPRLGS